MSADQSGGAVEHPADVVARAKAALEGITPGPWSHCVGPEDEDHADYMEGTLIRSGEPLHVLIADSPDAEYAYIVPAITGDGPRSGRNAEFIAAARSLVPDLIAELEAARTILSDLIDPDICTFDHDGDCQAHGVFGIGPGDMCPHEAAKRLLGLRS